MENPNSISIPTAIEACARDFREGRATLIAVVIPCFRVRRHILEVLATIPAFVARVYVVDDACPENTGDWVEQSCDDERVLVMRNPTNLGVGGAVMNGYRAALADGIDVVVKLDGDGQMDSEAMIELIAPIVDGEADYCKGNRFYDLEHIARMPPTRIIGNAALSFLTKISSGYWDVFDPTNGYTAIHAEVLRRLPLEKISKRYFFESDLLFRLNIVRAVVIDLPMDARYGDEQSNLKIFKVVPEFALLHAKNTLKRIFYNYFLRDMSLASIQLVLGILFTVMGLVLGIVFWVHSASTGTLTSPGSVTLVALLSTIGLLLAQGFLAYDIASIPRRPLQRTLKLVKNLTGTRSP